MSSLASALPSVQSGLVRLAGWLAAEGYPSASIGRILGHAIREGTPTGAPDLDPADEEHAEHAFVEGLQPVALASPDWDEHDTDPGRGPVYRTVGADYTLDRLNWWLDVVLPPIAGGAPAPTAEEAVETMRRWYRERASFRDWLEREGGQR